MKIKGFIGRIWTSVFDDYPSCLIPQKWAAESLMVLLSNTIMLPLVHQDFKNEVAREGDVVNTRRPGTFEAKRKKDGDDVVSDDPTATNVKVTLDQHIYESFIVYDVAESTSFVDLLTMYIQPAMDSIAQIVDQILHAQAYNFLGNTVGKLGVAPDETTVIALREKMNENKVPMAGRNCVITPSTEGDLLEVTQFVNANQVGDDGSAMREGNVGRKFGINFFMTQNALNVPSGNTVKTGLVNNVGGYAAGATSIVTDGRSSDPVAGEWVIFEGDNTPQLCTVFAVNTLTISPGLRYDIDDDAAMTVYKAGAVDQAVAPTGYAADWNKDIVIDGFTVAPKSGQMITFGTTDSYKYGAVNTPTTTSMLLDRSLEAAIADNAVVGIGPAGNYNFCFHRNAIAFVTRPLQLPLGGSGVQSAVANYGGLGLRVTIGYDMVKQGHRVTIDLLAGVKVLDTNLGCLMFG